MHTYLPIAEISASVPVLFGLGLVVGVMSGLFGVGGGFILTPLLFMIGIPSTIAVGTQGNLIVGSSFSGLLAHLRRKTVDFPMGIALLIGGLAGSFFGVRLFHWLTTLGQIDLVIKLSYVGLLGTIGALMMVEALTALRRRKSAGKVSIKRKHHNWIHGLPFRYRFRASGLYISVIPPLGIGVLVGVMAAIMGVGGGFIMVPAMIYLLNMPTKTVIGTSLFQITFLAGFTTMMQATTNFTVDFVMAFYLLIGGVVGAQIGTRLGAKLDAETLRVLLAGLVLAVSVKIAVELALPPAEVYSIVGG
ncbi:MAG: sulfite exporter TauE/SafE family protein [Alphaproteobacteria bacterium]|nr:MAG: sulfite exporter TauE/SafE family protein [Alphaproteobacteria bacterium]